MAYATSLLRLRDNAAATNKPRPNSKLVDGSGMLAESVPAKLAVKLPSATEVVGARSALTAENAKVAANDSNMPGGIRW